jgi:myo-inositol-1(or 4)-monophosphatase
MINLPARLALATQIAERGGQLARRYFDAREQLATTCKGRMDFASEADTAVERLLRNELAMHVPGEAIVGEELGGTADASAWVLDPIDGTSHFLRGSPLWGVAVAYVAEGEPIVGAIHYPVLGMTVVAATGLGLFVDGKPVTRSVPFPDVRIVAIGSNARWDITQTSALETHLRQHQWTATGYRCASVGLGFAALGYVDGYFEDHTHVWDIAAGMVLCREAGLIVESAASVRAGTLRVAAGTPALMQVAMPFWSSMRDAAGSP